jgi:hypothetical protein
MRVKVVAEADERREIRVADRLDKSNCARTSPVLILSRDSVKHAVSIHGDCSRTEGVLQLPQLP